MPEYCNCGAELPPDARFCHKCGKPQRDEIIPETVESLAPPPVSLPVAPPAPSLAGVNFHNPIAVRIGLSMASAAALLTWLPLVGLGFIVWWMSAGFFSVYLYRRRTGQLLTVSGGIRLGWVTGILTAAILTVLITGTLVLLALSGGGLASVYQEQLRNMHWSDASIQQAVNAFSNPAMLAISILSFLLLVFAFVTFFCTAGGALGAKLAGRS